MMWVRVRIGERDVIITHRVGIRLWVRVWTRARVMCCAGIYRECFTANCVRSLTTSLWLMTEIDDSNMWSSFNIITFCDPFSFHGPRTTVISFHASFFTPLDTSSELHVGIETLRLPSVRLITCCFLFSSQTTTHGFLVLHTLIHRTSWWQPVTEIRSLLITMQLNETLSFDGNQENVNAFYFFNYNNWSESP